MGRAPCCDKAKVKKGPWSPEEDSKLKEYIEKYGTGGNWIALPLKAGLKRCGKSCRLRWLNYLRPDIKHGQFSEEEDRTICTLFANIGSRWSIIASHLPGRTDNDIKNYWNTKLKKKLMGSMPPPIIPSPPSIFHQGLSISYPLTPMPPTSSYNYPNHSMNSRVHTPGLGSVVPWETLNNTYFDGNVNINNGSQSQSQFMMFDNYNQVTEVISNCSNSSEGSFNNEAKQEEGILGINNNGSINQSHEFEDNHPTFILNNNNHVLQQGYFGDYNNINNNCFFSTSHDQYYGY